MLLLLLAGFLPLAVGLPVALMQAGKMEIAAQQLSQAEISQTPQISADLYNQVQSARQRLVFVLGLTTGVAVLSLGLAAYRFSRRFATERNEIAEHLNTFAQGDFSRRVQGGNLAFLVDLEKPLNEAAEKLGSLFTGLADHVRLRTEELNQQVEQAERVYQGSRALASSQTLNGLLEMILAQIDRIVINDRAALLLQEGDRLVIAAGRGFPAGHRPNDIQIGIKPGDVFDEIYRSRQPLIIPDVQQRSDWQNVLTLPKTRSWVGIPLVSSEEVIGMLSLARMETKPFNRDEVMQAATFAVQAAYAIQNARLLEEITHFNQELEEKVEQRTDELAAAYEQLERLDRTKSNFINIASHELRTPLTVVSGYSQMLLLNPLVKEDEHLQELAGGIYNGAARLHEIVNAMVELAKIDSRVVRLDPKPLSVETVIQSVLARYQKAFQERKLTFSTTGLDGLPVIEADEGGLWKVFSNLLSNAVKFTPDGGSITISGQVQQPERDFLDGGVRLVVADTGIGIDPPSIELIFSRFYQTGEVSLHSSGTTKFKGGGPGLGLTIARGIVEMHRGRLWAESPGLDEQTCPGSSFIVVLPTRQRPPTRELLGARMDSFKEASTENR